MLSKCSGQAGHRRSEQWEQNLATESFTQMSNLFTPGQDTRQLECISRAARGIINENQNPCIRGYKVSHGCKLTHRLNNSSQPVSYPLCARHASRWFTYLLHINGFHLHHNLDRWKLLLSPFTTEEIEAQRHSDTWPWSLSKDVEDSIIKPRRSLKSGVLNLKQFFLLCFIWLGQSFVIIWNELSAFQDWEIVHKTHNSSLSWIIGRFMNLSPHSSIWQISGAGSHCLLDGAWVLCLTTVPTTH